MAEPRKKTAPPAGRGRCRALFQKIWHPIRKRWDSVVDLRFNVLLLLLGVLLAWVAPQGRDVIATISDSWEGQRFGTCQWWLFLAAIWFLGFQLWLWSRVLLRRCMGEKAMRDDRLLVQLPRILGTIPYLVAAGVIALVPEGKRTGLQVALVLALAILAYLFYWRRLGLAARLASSTIAKRLLRSPAAALDRLERAVLIASVLLALAMLIWLAADPVTLPLWLGSAALAFLGFALAVPAVNALIALFQGERFPVLTGLLLLALIASFTNDNHRIRTLDEAGPPPRRETLEQAYDRWVAQAPPDPAGPAVPGQPAAEPSVTAVLVSAAGGASRAGLWTLEALLRLDTADPAFNRRIFAINAVSGSAMGAVDYVASITALPGGDRETRHLLAREHAGADFLSPALGGLFYTDLAQRFIPFGPLRDRAWSIERGFEEAWAVQCRERHLSARCAELMRGPFLHLWQGRSAIWRPNLLLIGTIEEDGRRIATSNLDLVERLRDGRPVRPRLPNVYDYFEVSGRHVAASTAIMNSARFPWISPAGGLVGHDDNRRGHIVDGGYFETSGADTTEDLAAALLEINRRRCRQAPAGCLRLNIVYLTLLNGDLVIDAQPQALCQPRGSPVVDEASVDPDERMRPICRRRPLANDALAPLYALFRAEVGRATRPLTRLARLRSADGLPIEIRLSPCRTERQRPLAMNWVLSAPTRDRMRAQLAAALLQPEPPRGLRGCAKRTQDDMSRLAAALHIPPPPSPRP